MDLVKLLEDLRVDETREQNDIGNPETWMDGLKQSTYFREHINYRKDTSGILFASALQHKLYIEYLVLIFSIPYVSIRLCQIDKFLDSFEPTHKKEVVIYGDLVYLIV